MEGNRQEKFFNLSREPRDKKSHSDLHFLKLAKDLPEKVTMNSLKEKFKLSDAVARSLIKRLLFHNCCERLGNSDTYSYKINHEAIRSLILTQEQNSENSP